MKIKQILNTDVLTKLDAMAPGATEICPDVMDLANAFGTLRMRILCDLLPIELMYFIDSNHEMRYTLNGWEIDLSMVDIVFHLPDQFMTLYKADTPIDQIYQDEIVCGLMENTLSQEAQKRFGENRYLNQFIPHENVEYFNGWRMDMLGIGWNEIVPNTPSNTIENMLNNSFSAVLNTDVQDILQGYQDSLVVKSLFSKRVTWSEFLMLARNSHIKIVNLTGNIHEFIRDEIVPDGVYDITDVPTVSGGKRETVTYDFDKMNEIIENKAMIGVIVETTTEFKKTGQFTIEAEIKNEFDEFCEFIMHDNILSVYKDDLVEDADGNLVEYEQVEDAPTEEEHVEEPEPDVEEDAIAQYVREVMDELNDESVEDELPMTEDDHISLFDEPSDEESVSNEETESREESTPKDRHGIFAALSFFCCGATFDTISQIERNPEYQKPDTIGIICMNDGSNFTYMMGHPNIVSEDDDPIRYQWVELDHDKLFSEEESKLFYYVYDWIGYDKKVEHGVLWENYKFNHTEGARNEIEG